MDGVCVSSPGEGLLALESLAFLVPDERHGETLTPRRSHRTVVHPSSLASRFIRPSPLATRLRVRGRELRLPIADRCRSELFSH